MSNNRKYDAIIIGTGQAGNPFAKYIATMGFKVAIIEKERDSVGGTCVNWGCTPTKTLYASARVALMIHRSKDYGIHVHDKTVNFQEVMNRKNHVVKIWHEGAVKGLTQSENIDLFYGEGSFIDEKTVQIKLESGEQITIDADKIFINTGARAKIPQIPGLETIEYLDNRKILQLQSLPEHLVIIGSGYIALEFGQMFHRFGSEVTIIARGDRLLSKEDPDISQAVREVLEEEGIQIMFHSSVQEIRRLSSKVYSYSVNHAGKLINIQASDLLLAIGRVPNYDMINLT